MVLMIIIAVDFQGLLRFESKLKLLLGSEQQYSIIIITGKSSILNNKSLDNIIIRFYFQHAYRINTSSKRGL